MSARTAVPSELQPSAVPRLTISFPEFVLLTAALMAITALSIDIMLPALPAIGTALHVATENDRQLIIILYMAGFATGQLFYGPLSDQFGRKPVLLAGLGIFLIGTVAAIAAHSFTALLAARLIQGFGAASPRVVAIAIVRDLYSGRHMARVMSFTMMVFIMIPVLAPSFGQALLHVGDWHWTFYALLILGLAVSLWAALRLPETGHTNRQRNSLVQSFRTVATNPQTLVYGSASGLMFGCLLAYVASAEQVFIDVFHLGDWFPVAFGAVASTMAFASFFNARWVEKLGMRRVSHTALIGFASVAVVMVLTAMLNVTVLPVFVILMALAFFLFGLVGPNFNALAMEPHGDNAGMASSVIGALSTGIGAAAGGLVASNFHGTVLPLTLGFAACRLSTLGMVVWLEGRAGLFGRPTAV